MLIAKFCVTLTMLWISGLLVGSSALAQFHLNKVGMIFAQAGAPPVIVTPGASANDALVAVHTEKLDEIARQNQAGIDDRKQLHDQLNTLANKLAVDEAQLKGAGWTFGIALSVLNAVHTILLVMDYRRKKQGVVCES